MSKTFNISIIAPGKDPLKLEAESLITLTKDGEIEFKANHAPIILSTIPTTTLIINGTKKEKIFTSTGIIYLKDNELKFCCDAVERESDIDVDRAEKSKERAEKRLKEEKNIDVERAKRALARANARIGTISINH
ncbi:ATP synthase delta/epsilon chain alpha-helix domain-containing protein [Clostridium tertium]|jgi:F-type H+-transporting ATPase subunit epsilon|uniref:ATP synthase delta/epsilon chain alpha-helix domain-containing protein n=1 Tax=Clostridium TaxID=1485 RepID=UPI0011575108|nr:MULTISPECIES: ATP synthase delta/epsilon chain alpha-helix domain-containing protein [Clostridium]MBS5307265.1 F0F1 ATP synthase subunit epsilon [Clostridium sp.]MDB1924252.1 ATP synthase delta/epsilon chain alpha-helix domain-containing protein [Clostridium tertium]MDB1927400.1 ATP synthase delta/epsilon chain alpha-helix domain-containing protein [Clostridium tertium]MDB1931330.1 ATP synthase delta/epsilon chain alpha-helix domain-containing protein [Clostridium tertium]MDB1935198.1 ATP s